MSPPELITTLPTTRMLHASRTITRPTSQFAGVPEAMEVPSLGLSPLLRALCMPKLDLLKLDIEG